MKIKLFFIIFSTLCFLFLINDSNVFALSCPASQCGGYPHVCDVCDNVTGSCVQCGEPGGGIKGECAGGNTANNCGSECCNGGQCGPCSGGTFTCPAGTHDNGRCIPGQALNPPCCSADVVCPPRGTCPACGPATTVDDGACNKITCAYKACPTTPPGGCSANPSICGTGRCCISGLCGTCPPTPTTPGGGGGEPIVYDHGGRILNDKDETCKMTANSSDNDWTLSDQAYDYRMTISTISESMYNELTVHERIQAMKRNAKADIVLHGGAGFYLETQFRPTSKDLYLWSLPPGYRCSSCNTSSCPIKTNAVFNGSNSYFYITNKAETPSTTSDSWWQVKDGEVTTDGNLTSKLPSGSMFNIVGLGGFHGLPIFGGSLNTGSGTISTLLWNANTLSSFTRIFNYSFFENLIPDDVVLNDVSKLATGVGATVYSDGYEWFKITGNHTISSDINLGSRKVILFVKSGNLNIDSKINLTDHSGFFAAFVNGSTIINPALTNTEPNPALEGLYLSDGSFTTGAGTALLHLRGSVVSFGPITLGRNLSNNATRAELFEYAPDQIMLFPEKLKFKKTKWTEVAP